MALAALQRGGLRSRLLDQVPLRSQASERTQEEPENSGADVARSSSSSPQDWARSSSQRRTSAPYSAPPQLMAPLTRSSSSGKPVDRMAEVAAAARLAIVNGRKALQQVSDDSVDLPFVVGAPRAGNDATSDSLAAEQVHGARQAPEEARRLEEEDGDEQVSTLRADMLGLRAMGSALEDVSEPTSDPSDATPAAMNALLPVDSSARSGSRTNDTADEERQRMLRREERRRARDDEMQRRAVELEQEHNHRYQQKVMQVRDADERARHLQDELAAVQQRKQEKEQELRDEVAEVRQATERLKASAKAKARALRESRDNSEKAVQAARNEATSYLEQREAATRSVRAMSASIRRELSAMQDEQVIATSVSEELAMQLKSSEQSCTLAGQELAALQQEAIGMRGVARDIEARVNGKGAEGDAVGGAIVAKVAAEAAERSAKTEEAAINAELSGVEVRCLSLNMEEQTVVQRLAQVEAETGRLKDCLRRSPGVAATPNGQIVWQLTEERDAARLQLNEMHRNIEREAAAVVMQAAMEEASSSAAHREDAACAELTHVYEQLRGVVAGKDRDLATLSAVAKEQQNSVSSLHDEKSQIVMTELMAHARASREMALDEHAEVIQRMQAQHVQFVCESELVLCDLALVHAELSEAQQREESLCAAARDEVRNAQSAIASGAVAMQRSAMPADGETHLTVAQVRNYRANLQSLISKSGFGPAHTDDLLVTLHRRVRELQVKLSEVRTSLREHRLQMTYDELLVEEAGSEARELDASPLNIDGLAEMSKTLHSSTRQCDDECGELSNILVRLQQEFQAKRQAFSQGISSRADMCNTREVSFEQELSAKQADLIGTEVQAQNIDKQIATLQSSMKDASSEQERMMRKIETDYEVTERMRDRLAALGTADEELHARYKMLSKRAEDAARACASEERTVRTAGAELAAVQQSRTDAEAALSSEMASLDAVAADLETALATAEARREALNREELRPGEISANFASLTKKLVDERAAAAALEMDASHEQEQSLVLASRLVSARAEASEVSRSHEDEVREVARLRQTLLSQRKLELPPPSLSDSFGRELERMHSEVEALSNEEAQLNEARSRLTVELNDAHQHRATLQRALHAQEENDAQVRDTQRKAAKKLHQDRAAEIVALGAAAASEEAKVERANAALEEAMRSIGPLHGELLCTEAAGTTEAEALAMVRNDMDVESAACNAVRQRLSNARSELAALKAQITELDVRASASTGRAFRGGDDSETDMQRHWIDLDVVEVMSQAIRSSSPTGDDGSESLAAVGTPQFAQQILDAQALLEELHHKELLAIKERGRTWRRTLEDEAIEHQARQMNLEQLMRTETWSWAADKERLSQRVRSGEQEHVQLERNLLKEISRRENAAAEDTGLSVARTETGSATATRPWMAEAALGLEAAAGGDGTVLARMNHSLQDTHHLLCDQQKQIEEIAGERDRLQAHLISALERASLQNSGVASGSPQPPSPPSAELAAGLHALLRQSGVASSPV